MDNNKEIKAQCFPLVARPGGAVRGQEGRPDQLLADAFCPGCCAGPDSEVESMASGVFETVRGVMGSSGVRRGG